MIYTAKIIADSVNPSGQRLTTIQLCYPRFIHAEFMTHRVFSRNASSSRAIPVRKLIERVRSTPAMFVQWGANKPGMQAGEALSESDMDHAKTLWLAAMDAATGYAEQMSHMNPPPHKQIINRLLEPFVHIDVIVTATDWDNFFDLRLDPAAQPEIQRLAQEIKAAMDASTPSDVDLFEWHLPYIDSIDVAEANRVRGQLPESTLRRMSAARCARVSYLTHDGERPTMEADLKLANMLINMRHDSPLEHQATPSFSMKSPMQGNLRGWDQFRKQVEHMRAP